MTDPAQATPEQMERAEDLYNEHRTTGWGGTDIPAAIVAAILAADHQQAELMRHLNALLDAQNVQPYRGWNITALNKATDEAREYLGLPSIRDLNPDVAKMMDTAAVNKLAEPLRLSQPQTMGNYVDDYR